MFLGIDHVGFMIEDPARAGAFMKALGLSLNDQGVGPGYGVSCQFWQFSPAPEEVALELVTPTRDDSAISAPLATRGPGLYHVAFEVDDLEGDAEQLVKAGFVNIDGSAQEGARPGMQVVYLYSPDPVNSLMELVQYEKPKRRR
jgi:methylmalonyl-CoA/ethylmalonyl-CoA epimerase